ncbi:hypothetical protein KKD87_00095 [bacterium]|nr:hypothetical protein [bacterium]
MHEVRTARENLWRECNYDLDQLCERLREKQISHGLQVVTKAELLGKQHITAGLRRLL